MNNFTIEPASEDFGEVTVGATSSSTTFTITAQAPLSVVFRDDSNGFTASPALLTLAKGDTQQIAVTFEPSARTVYNASFIADFDGTEQVIGTVRGSGVQKVPADTETVEGESYLCRVADFTSSKFERANGGQNVETMTAFLRIGSFDLTDESARSLELLDLIPQAGAASNPSGLTSSVQIVAENGEFGTIFADDVRTRPQDVERLGQTEAVFGENTQPLGTEDDPGNKLTLEQRHRESSRLYSRGGWRDHSDGNRISTTYGDRVDVVRGNYKLLVMGRQDNVDEAIGWEAGGSHVQDYAPGTMPGASFWLEWINDPRYYAPLFGPNGDLDEQQASQKGLWLLVNTTENVYEYARYAGNFREERWGDVIETYVGSENPPQRGAFALDSLEGTKGHEPIKRLDDRNYDLPEEHKASNELRNVPLWTDDNIGKVRSNPHIIERTWAERIDRTQGSKATPIPKGIFEERFTSRFEEVFVATNNIIEKRSAPRIETTLDAGFGRVTEKFVGRHVEMFLGTHTELFLGVNTSIKCGGFIDITLGAFETNIDMVGFRHEIVLAGAFTDIKMATKLYETELFGTRAESKIGAKIETVITGAQVAIGLGGLLFFGDAADYNFGAMNFG